MAENETPPEGVVSPFEFFTRRNIATIKTWMKETGLWCRHKDKEILFLRNKITTLEQSIQNLTSQLHHALAVKDKEEEPDHPSDYANNDPATRKAADNGAQR